MGNGITTGMQAFIDELGLVVGTLTHSDVQVAVASAAPGARHWYATLAGDSDPAAAVGIAIDQESAAMLARLVSGGAGGVEEASIADLLRNLLTQAAAALAMRTDDTRIELRLERLEPRADPPGESGFTAFTMTAPAFAMPLAIALGPIAPADHPAAVTDAPFDSRFDVILDIDLPVVVRFGHTELPIRALSRLGPGSVIDLGRSPDDPVEVLVSNRVVAHGEVVIVGGNYGVRILDVASHSERARSMEAR